MKNNKKLRLICILSGILIMLGGSVYALQGESLSKALGMKQAEILSSVDDEAVATIDGEKMTKKGLKLTSC